MGSYFHDLLFGPLLVLYSFYQWILDLVFSPEPPKPGAKLGRPKVAVIGAGLTGVSAASHIVGHGFDVTIFEAGGPESVGGIWSVRAPATSVTCVTIANTNNDRKSTTRQVFK